MLLSRGGRIKARFGERGDVCDGGLNSGFVVQEIEFGRVSR